MASGIIADKKGLYKHQSLYQTHPGALSEIFPDEMERFTDDDFLELGTYSYLVNGFKNRDSWAFTNFQFPDNEKLAAVGIFTINRNETVTVNVYKNSHTTIPLISKSFNIAEMGYHLLELGKEIPVQANETVVIGIGFKNHVNQKRLPLVYVRDNGYQFTYPTFFASGQGGSQTLTPYSDLFANCSFFIQAIVSKK